MTDYTIWECLICGWVYDEAKGWPEDGIEPGTRWEDVPDDWLCPECGVGKADFEMVVVASPTQASAVVAEPNAAQALPYQIWECLVCGWIYDETKGWPEDGISPGTRWADVPSDWLCPECGVGKADFEMQAVTQEPAESIAVPLTAAIINNTNTAPIIIIGSGLAGYGLAKEIRKLDSNTPVLVLTADDGRYYSKPLLSTGFHKQKSADAMATATAQEMAQQFNIEVRTGCEVNAIDSGGKTLQVGDDTIPYSKLILANGAACIEAPLSGTGLSHTYSVNDLQDYARFRTAITGKKKVLLIGAGLIGCEYANDLIQSGYEVDAVDPMPTVLANLLPAIAAESVKIALESAGVKFHFETVVKKIDLNRSGEGVCATLANGETIDADIVLSAIGVRPRTNLAISAGLAVNRGIVVDRHLKTSANDIYALGDCAEVDGHLLFYVAPLMACARALAKTLNGENTQVYYGTLPVMVKTTLYPVVTNPPAKNIAGEWSIEQSTAKGVKAIFKESNGTIAGFALTGECIQEKDALTKLTRPLMIQA